MEKLNTKKFKVHNLENIKLNRLICLNMLFKTFELKLPPF